MAAWVMLGVLVLAAAAQDLHAGTSGTGDSKDCHDGKLRCGNEQHVQSITHKTMLAWIAVLGVLECWASAPCTSIAFPRKQLHQPGTAGASRLLLSHRLVQLLCD